MQTKDYNKIVVLTQAQFNARQIAGTLEEGVEYQIIGEPLEIDDTTTSTSKTWSSNKINTTKQDIISDLSTIRSGATLGTTSLQPTAQSFSTLQKTQIRTNIGAEEADATILKQANIVDNVTSTTTTAPLSANQGRVLQDEILNLQNIGRFLSLWICPTGMPSTNPSTLPYTYRTGDYYRVLTVDSPDDYSAYDSTHTYNIGDKCFYSSAYYICNTDGTTGTWDSTKWTAHTIVNYIPIGSSYTGTASTAQYSGEANDLINGVFYFDGTNWNLQKSGGEGKVKDVQIASTTIVDGNGIATIPTASPLQQGVVRPNPAHGINIDGGAALFTVSASSSDITNKTESYKVIVPSNLDVAIKEGLGNYNLGTGNVNAWSDAYQSHAREVINAETNTLKVSTSLLGG